MPSPSLILSVGALIYFFTVPVVSKPIDFSSPIGTSLPVTANYKNQYSRDTSWQGKSFFDNFNFVTSEQYMHDLNRSDPTNGFVNYVDEKTALNSSLINFKNGNPCWGVDTLHNYTLDIDWGRPSIRLESKQSWTHGLFVADIAHMPGASCGVWPAFWSLGSGAWPYHGEVDIIEGVNLGTDNQMTIHTSDYCNMSTPMSSALSPVFDYKTNFQGVGNCATNYTTSGCPVKATTPKNYGDEFNANGGGLYIMQWTSDFFKIWFFPRDEIPSYVKATLEDESPDVSKFGLPQANFVGGSGCDIDAHFQEHRFIFDTTFCGDWAGNAWPSNEECPSVAGRKAYESCAIYVGAHPEKYKEAYWEINAITIFKENPNYRPKYNNGTMPHLH